MTPEELEALTLSFLESLARDGEFYGSAIELSPRGGQDGYEFESQLNDLLRHYGSFVTTLDEVE